MDTDNSSSTLTFNNSNYYNELDNNNGTQSESVQNFLSNSNNTTLENNATTTNNYINSTINHVHNYAQDDIVYILAPLIVIMAIAIFSSMALLCMQRRKKERYRHRFMPIYKFTPENDENEWSVLIDNETINATRTSSN